MEAVDFYSNVATYEETMIKVNYNEVSIGLWSSCTGSFPVHLCFNKKNITVKGGGKYVSRPDIKIISTADLTTGSQM